MATPTTRPLAYDRRVAQRLIARIAAGEMLRELWRDPTLPSRYTLIAWRKANPGFARRLRQAVNAARSRLRIAQSPYQEPTFELILARLHAGWSMRDIVRDPAMPSWTVIRDWLRTRPDFRRDVAIAREMYADRMAAEGWAMAEAATPATARQVAKALAQIRWRVSKLLPKVYLVEAPAEKAAPASPRRALPALPSGERSPARRSAGKVGRITPAGSSPSAGPWPVRR